MIEQISRSKHVIWNVVDGEAVLLNTQSGIYYGMNKTASAVWNLLEVPKTVEEIVLELLKRFSVEHATLSRDIEEVVMSLGTKHLIERSQV